MDQATDSCELHMDNQFVIYNSKVVCCLRISLVPNAAWDREWVQKTETVIQLT